MEQPNRRKKKFCIDIMRGIIKTSLFTKDEAYNYLCSIGYKDSYMEEYEKEVAIDRNWDDQYDAWKERQQFEGEI